jgi:RNA polymerase sigma-70 factor (ECF subfamily)
MIANEEGLRRLMRMSQSGDKQAYAVLLEQCGGWLARYFRQKIAPDAVDDLVQETLISLHRKRASYDPSRPSCPAGRHRTLSLLTVAASYRHQTGCSITMMQPKKAMKKSSARVSVSTVCSISFPHRKPK